MSKNNLSLINHLPKKNQSIESSKTKPLDKGKMTGKPNTNSGSNNEGGNQNRGN